MSSSTFADNLLTPMSSKMSISFFLQSKRTSMGTKRFKVQKTLSVQTVQRVLNDSRWWIRVLS